MDGKEIKFINEVTAHKSYIFKIIKIDKKTKNNKRPFLATCSDDRLIKIWKFKGDKYYKKLIGHRKVVFDILSFNEGEKIISCSGDGTIKVWNWLLSECLKTLHLKNCGEPHEFPY